MPTYEVYTDAFGYVYIVRFNKDGSISYIPEDPNNSDYQAYLVTLASESANDPLATADSVSPSSIVP